ncbi:MAG: sodium:alanine symporter family protein [Clostridia bacterium]|nr:sodium:alanine symporter family protein [Clostridia bacterium]
MAEKILTINQAVCDFLWGPYMLGLFFFTGLLFTIGTGFFQIRSIRLWLSHTFFSLFKKEKNKKGCISQFQSFTTVLAATVGTGNITGVAAALSLGGPGAIFWMWVSAFFGMMTAYAESVLAILYRQKDKEGNAIGGAMYYMEKGLGLRFPALLFSLFCILASFGMGNMAQMHSVSSALSDTFSIPATLTGILSSVLIAIIISGGLKRIAGVTEKLVPFMVIIFFIGSFICLYKQRVEIPDAFRLIFHCAFSSEAIAGGTLGYSVKKAMQLGCKRGVFSNEAGLGSGATAHASSSADEPCIQGMWGIFEVFVDTILVCTLTALVILTSGKFPAATAGLAGVSLTATSFGVGLGDFGRIFISVSIVFFAFATVIGWSLFGERSVLYLFGKKGVPIYKAIYILCAYVGSVTSMELVWGISDTFNALMAIPNLLCLIALSGRVFSETRRFMHSPYVPTSFFDKKYKKPPKTGVL